MAFTYMLRCADGTLYVGSTRNLEKRLYEHGVGLGAEYTRHRLPVTLVWHEEHEHIGSAFAREKQVQNWSRAKRMALIEHRYEGLPALAECYAVKERRARREREAGGLDAASPSGSAGSTTDQHRTAGSTTDQHGLAADQRGEGQSRP